MLTPKETYELAIAPGLIAAPLSAASIIESSKRPDETAAQTHARDFATLSLRNDPDARGGDQAITSLAPKLGITVPTREENSLAFDAWAGALRRQIAGQLSGLSSLAFELGTAAGELYRLAHLSSKVAYLRAASPEHKGLASEAERLASEIEQAKNALTAVQTKGELAPATLAAIAKLSAQASALPARQPDSATYTRISEWFIALRLQVKAIAATLA